MKLLATLVTAAIIATTPASFAQIRLPGGLGGGTSLPNLGGGLPGIGSASTGNVTGLLGYCLKNKLGSQLGEGNGVLAKLQGRPDVTQSPDYQAGLAGKLLGGNSTGTSASGAAGALGRLSGGGGGATSGMLGRLSGGGGGGSKPLSLDSLPSSVRTKACDAVLSHAKSLI